MCSNRKISIRSLIISELDSMSDKYGYPYVTGLMDYYSVDNMSESSITDEQLIAYRNMVFSANKNNKRDKVNLSEGYSYDEQACL